jgi:hypothetical protein
MEMGRTSLTALPSDRRPVRWIIPRSLRGEKRGLCAKDGEVAISVETRLTGIGLGLGICITCERATSCTSF